MNESLLLELAAKLMAQRDTIARCCVTRMPWNGAMWQCELCRARAMKLRYLTHRRSCLLAIAERASEPIIPGTQALEAKVKRLELTIAKLEHVCKELIVAMELSGVHWQCPFCHTRSNPPADVNMSHEPSCVIYTAQDALGHAKKVTERQDDGRLKRANEPEGSS